VRKLNARWGAVRLPKEKSWVKFRLSRGLPSEPTGVTLKLSPSGEYTVSFTVRQPISEPNTSGGAAGVDMGLIDVVTVVQSDGERYKISAPKNYRRAERKLGRLQCEHSRKKTDSKNRERARLRLAKQHARVARQRLDLACQIAAKLTSENQAVSFEALNLTGLVKTRLSKSFADAGLGQLAACVEQAAKKRGTLFLKVNPVYTSQRCSVCEVVDGPKPLSVREWVCKSCGASLDRDFNAAMNILLAGGHSESLNGLRGRISRSQLAGLAMSVEETTVYAAHKPRKRRARAKSMARRALLKAQALA
jgi:putative transposase